ncbi:hypothetical protein [Taklimakanibacter deserti]|uniref:hypothetical protein n=1 Tax=Taklimakanibacter deserti TaxID=2267839 RepID=UPI0013C417F8
MNDYPKDLSDLLPPDLAARADFPISKKSPIGTGLWRSRVPTARERLADAIYRNLYGEDPGRKKYSDRLTEALEFTPVGALLQAYDTGRALGEGRINDGLTAGAMAGLPPARKLPVNRLFNPKPKPQRSLFEDYPNRPKLYRNGDIKRDIEGRPLKAIYVAGRARADEPDHALTPIDIQRVGEYGIQGPVEKVPSSQLGPGNLGETHLMLGRPMRMKVLDTLPKDQMEIATAHEVSHVVDALAGQIPTKGLGKELDFNYSALRTGEERTANLVRPQDYGYRGRHLVDRERMAEAIRAYMVDPNYFKTIAPKTAARIREYVYRYPELRKIIQFNSLAAAGAGLALMGQSDESQAASQGNAVDGGHSSIGPTIPFEVGDGAIKATANSITGLRGAFAGRDLSKPTERNNLVRALRDLEIRKMPYSYGGPR